MSSTPPCLRLPSTTMVSRFVGDDNRRPRSHDASGGARQRKWRLAWQSQAAVDGTEGETLDASNTQRSVRSFASEIQKYHTQVGRNVRGHCGAIKVTDA